MRSAPRMYGRNTSGINTLPSGWRLLSTSVAHARGTAMAEPLQQKTITLSCGKLTTGVSVKPWTGILMLRNSSSPETYFQAAFRVQTPWTARDPDDPNREVILKEECYVFDFAPNRALRQIQEYSCRLNPTETNPEALKHYEDFTRCLE